MANCTVIEFAKSVPPYHAGEKAGFAHEIAEAYVRAGVAKIIRPNAPVVDPKTIEAQRAALADERSLALRVNLAELADGRRAGAAARA